jgi:CBS domain containing-hemolysin-like protein
VRKALGNLYSLLSATQLGITLTSILLGYVAEETVAHLFHDWFATLPRGLDFLTRGGIASVVAVGTISFLHVVFGELVPKTWAITHPEATSRWVATPLIVFSWITRPFNVLLNVSARAILRLLGIKSTSPELDRVHSPEEIRMLVQQSRRTGGLEASDARLLEGVFEFSEKNARDVMTPRTEMVALPAEASLAEAADRVAAAGRSRYPVTGESLDDVVGIVHAKDILRGLLLGAEAPVQDIARPAFFVPGTREVEDVLADMKRQKVHLAIVLDEFGGTAGLVTMEDLLEEIVGPIYDEYDQAPTAAPGTATSSAGSGVPILPGSAEIDDVNRLLKLHLDDADYTTIGGLLFGRLGRLPKVGDRVNLQGATFEILEMDGRRVGRVRVWPSTTHVPEPSS